MLSFQMVEIASRESKNSTEMLDFYRECFLLQASGSSINSAMHEQCISFPSPSFCEEIQIQEACPRLAGST